MIPRPFARVWAASSEAKDATREMSGLAEKRDAARAQYDAVCTFIHDTVDALHSQSPWLLIPPSSKENKNKRHPNGKIHNLNAATRGREAGDSGDPKPSDQERMKAKQSEYGPCPACNRGHTFKGKNGQMIASSRRTDCKKFASKTPDQMVDFLKLKDACTRCLSWLHTRQSCPYDYLTCNQKDNGEVCGKDHSRLLHKSKKPIIVNHAKTGTPDSDDILAPIVSVVICGIRFVALLDPGSSSTIITHAAARRIRAKSRFVKERIKLPGREEEELETCLYTFNWTVAGQTYPINEIGMTEITDNYGPVSVDEA